LETRPEGAILSGESVSLDAETVTRGACVKPQCKTFRFALAVCAGLAFAGVGEADFAAGAVAPTIVPVEKLMKIGALPDIVQGSPAAPDTIIEYASMTCSHCAAFHESVWPRVKSKYVDSGRAKFILREFPLDAVAAAGFMLARCAGPEKRNLLIDQLFAGQKDWAFTEKPIERLRAEVKKVEMSDAEFETCLKDQHLFEAVNQTRDLAAAAFEIHATPTFFVNGHKLTGEVAIEDFDKILEAPAK